MNRKPDISPEDATLFRDAVGAVAPLPRGGRVTPRRSPPSTRPRQSEADERAVMDSLLDQAPDPATLETGDELEFRQNGVQLSVMRKLRRGQYARQAELDLHGLNLAQARARLAGFLLQAQARSLRCVRIIHGKGLRSPSGAPVLKPQVASWLRRRKDVLAYCSAMPAEGGSGALYVLLRR
jgi:DNA-nicking Smr family endonuclease